MEMFKIWYWIEWPSIGQMFRHKGRKWQITEISGAGFDTQHTCECGSKLVRKFSVQELFELFREQHPKQLGFTETELPDASNQTPRIISKWA